MSDDNHAEHEHELVMPFLLVHSKGGPYDDNAFVSGWKMATLDMHLKYGMADPVNIWPVEKEQADLIAMRHGYKMTVESFGPEWDDHYVLAKFTYVGDETHE